MRQMIFTITVSAALFAAADARALCATGGILPCATGESSVYHFGQSRSGNTTPNRKDFQIGSGNARDDRAAARTNLQSGFTTKDRFFMKRAAGGGFEGKDAAGRTVQFRCNAAGCRQ